MYCDGGFGGIYSSDIPCVGATGTGYRLASAGDVGYSTAYSYYWTASLNDLAGRSLACYSSNTMPGYLTNRGNGFALRCIQEFTSRGLKPKRDIYGVLI